MTDKQPENPAARAPENATPTRIDRPSGGRPSAPDPTRIEGATAPDPTRVERTPAQGDGPPRPADPTRAEGPAAPTAHTPSPPPSPSAEDGGGTGPAADGTRDQGEQEPPARWSGSAAVPPHVPKRPWWSRRRATGTPSAGTPSAGTPNAGTPNAGTAGAVGTPSAGAAGTSSASEATAPVDPWADSEDWSATPAVDPWADQDTPWQAELPFPEAMPPTRIQNAMPPTRMEAPLPPTRMEMPAPTRSEAPLPPARAEAPLPPGQKRPESQAAKPFTWPNARRSTTPTGAGAAAGPPPIAPPPVAPTAAAGNPPRRRWGRKNRAKQTPQPPVNRLPIQPRPPAPPPVPPPAPPGRKAKARPAQLPSARPAPPTWSPSGRPVPPTWAPSGRPVPARPPQGRNSPLAQAPPHPGRNSLPEGKRPLPPPRRKRRWPRNLLLLTLASFVCCCGVPGYLAWPAARQYPVSAALPQTVADLDLRDDGASRRAVERLSEQLSGTSLVQGDVFAGVYADGDGKRVTVFGTTGLRFTPESDVEAELAQLTSEYKIKNIETFDLGETGVHERCGVGRSGDKAVVVCAWADHGSLATVLLTRRSVAESAELTGVLRSVVLTRG